MATQEELMAYGSGMMSDGMGPPPWWFTQRHAPMLDSSSYPELFMRDRTNLPQGIAGPVEYPGVNNPLAALIERMGAQFAPPPNDRVGDVASADDPGRAKMGQPSPSVVLPPVLDALRRQQLHQSGYNKFADQHQLDEQQRFRYARQYGAADPFPIGQQFVSNSQTDEQLRNSVPSPPVNPIARRLSGMGDPMGSQAPQADPLSTFIMHINNAASNEGLNYAGRGSDINIIPRAELVNDPNRQIEIGGQGGVNSKLGVTNKEAYKTNSDAFHAREQAKTDLLAQRGIARGEAANNRRMGHDPRLAALLATLGSQGGGGDMGQMLLGDAIGGRGAGLGLISERRLADTARGEKESFDKRTDSMNRAQGGAAAPGAPTGEDPARTAIKQTATKVYQQGLQDYSDPNRAASVAFGHLRSTTSLPVAEIYKIIREATGVDLESAEKNQERRSRRVTEKESTDEYRNNIRGPKT